MQIFRKKTVQMNFITLVRLMSNCDLNLVSNWKLSQNVHPGVFLFDTKNFVVKVGTSSYWQNDFFDI